jgi:transcriptional regulator with XRE-family HTH domain
VSAHIDPNIWDEPEMHRALASRDITNVYRLLCAAGLNQTQISKLTGQGQSEVSEILDGRRVLSYAVLERICAGLGIPRGHMGLAYTDADGRSTTYSEDETGVDSEVDDDMISRRFLGMASAALLGSAAVTRPIMQLGTAVLGEEGGLRLLNGPAGRLGKSDVAWITAEVPHTGWRGASQNRSSEQCAPVRSTEKYSSPPVGCAGPQPGQRSMPATAACSGGATPRR